MLFCSVIIYCFFCLFKDTLIHKLNCVYVCGWVGLCVYIAVNEELKATGKFDLMDLPVDEAEHSMEMHLPYIAKVFNG